MAYRDAVLSNLLWTKRIKEILTDSGLSNKIPKDFELTQKSITESVFSSRRESFYKAARENIEQSNKLTLFKSLKVDRGISNYLLSVKDYKLRRILSKFRLSNHVLEIEKGRHRNMKRHERLCPFCKNNEESEIHFLIQCPIYANLCKNT